MELNDSINAEFIKNSLISEIKNSFKNNLFSLNKITNNKEIDLKDEDFTVSGSINAKINYNYDSFKNLTTNLTIIIGEGQISNKYELNDGKINKFLQISDSIIFAATENGNIWEIDLETKTHKLKYDFKNKNNIIFDIKALSDTELILATEDKIYQYDLIKNEITEKINLKDGKIFSLSIEDLNNKIYATTDNNNVYELDSSFSQVKNKYELNASVYSSLIVDKKLFAGTITNVWELDIE
ncbi:MULTISPECIES: hypothetical protein [unclassified Spiroplasma]|uniref:hypothetical protein n=1 Tax=unclassified Spiroplasma TaxID=2637901 RepID=UPI0030CE397A